VTLAEVISIIAVCISGIAAVYAYRAPVRAERLRNESAQAERKLAIFNSLMAERGSWGSPLMLSALNSAKIAFRDDSAVLDKWFVLYREVGPSSSNVNAYIDLLSELARHLGMNLRQEDFEHYFTNPTTEKEVALRHHHVQTAFEQLTSTAASTSAGTILRGR